MARERYEAAWASHHPREVVLFEDDGSPIVPFTRTAIVLSGIEAEQLAKTCYEVCRIVGGLNGNPPMPAWGELEADVKQTYRDASTRALVQA